MEYAILQDHESLGYYIVPEEDVDNYTDRCEACGDSDIFITSFNTRDAVSKVVYDLVEKDAIDTVVDALPYLSKNAREIALECLEDERWITEVKLRQIEDVIKRLEKKGE